MIEEIETYHVLPVDDEREHTESADCACQPKIILVKDDNGDVCGRVISHNAWDCREIVEKAEAIFSNPDVVLKNFNWKCP